MWAHPLEQAAHNDAHTVEVARTCGTFHHVGHAAEVIDFRGRDGENLLHGGREDIVGQVADQLHVSLQCAGILFQILGIVELHGVYEDGAEDYVILLVGATDKGDVSFVKGTHCRHHADAFAGGTIAHSKLYQFLNTINYFHNNVLFNNLQTKIGFAKNGRKGTFFFDIASY